jgi:hypothetical protein
VRNCSGCPISFHGTHCDRFFRLALHNSIIPILTLHNSNIIRLALHFR